MMWAKKYACCQQCGMTEKPHMAKGLCKHCYLKNYRNHEQHVDRIAELKKQWYLARHDEQLLRRKHYREQRHFDGVREEVMQRDGHKCVRCGSCIKLVVHHKDRQGRGNTKPNNDPDNLETVCRKCHLNEHRSELRDAIQRKYDQPRLLKSGRWSTHFDACVSCGLTTSKHATRGLCNRCNVRRYATR